MKTLGILGAGQLGRMLALAARQFEFAVGTLDPHENSPCGQVANFSVTAKFNDVDAIMAFADRCDILTFEFENIPPETIAALEQRGKFVAPSSQVLRITQDRVFEKEFVNRVGLKTAPFAPISQLADIDAALAITGLPAIIKTRRGGYDGKGQWRVAAIDDAINVCHEVAQRRAPQDLDLIVEGRVSFERELSVIAARDHKGRIITFPIAENVHENGILSVTHVPARIDWEIQQMLRDIAQRIGDGLKYVGTFAVETFFIDGECIVNEIAPRVHNSGHYTLEATSYSQFEAHIRAISGLPLSDPLLLSPAVMLNILGAGVGDRLSGMNELLAIPGLALHLYGKGAAKTGRKMGHATIVRPTLDEALHAAEGARPYLIWAQKSRIAGEACAP